MKQTLLGYREFDFKDKETDRNVKGISLYTMSERDGVTGHEAMKLSVKTVPANIGDYLGAEINVDFDQHGKVVQITWPTAVGAGAGKPAGTPGAGGK